MGTEEPEQLTLVVTRWNPQLARGTKTRDTFTYSKTPEGVEEMYKHACWHIMLKLDSFDNHYRLAFKRCWDKKEYSKMLVVWKFLAQNSLKVVDIAGLRLEWDE
jgi:hypothetical protein